ncbi:Phosphoenolpyruvate/pyruvate domain-containing protein [Gonapodya prolifera JEL478]|uniref:Phosphoenolpyruvate/pyruvate domain-containing protein n=1 Tax=Gonapodya prolifera (strain JEL478) TaxID=1344416 RepID=A0A139AN90_GONPJ|nr:Phosphoenolpyruvate/pyruvate domain-containing protein [Gonapodya prolifera JEL478]|eukprot:KXS18219.1 Phosphoenolpyruvate/pyruvate domain-containing protein [Gonapodya prolifera JEL478]
MQFVRSRLAALTKLSVKPDCIVFDLEDSVRPEKKGRARELVLDALNLGTIEKTVRINSIGSGFEEDDLKVILQSPNVTSIHLPKTTSAHDVHTLEKYIEKIVGVEELRRREAEATEPRIICLIESAMAMLNLRSICESSTRVDALAFASVDYTADANLVNQPDRKEFIIPRQWLAMHASAFELQAIDMVCVDVKNDAYLEEEALEGRYWGYTGKAAIHPRQVEIINKAFAPGEKEVTQARRIVEGTGAFALDGKMIDEPVRKAAEVCVIHR